MTRQTVYLLFWVLILASFQAKVAAQNYFDQGTLGDYIDFWMEDSLVKFSKRGQDVPFLTIPLDRLRGGDAKNNISNTYGSYKFSSRNELQTKRSRILDYRHRGDTLHLFILLDETMAQLRIWPEDTADLRITLISDNLNMNRLYMPFWYETNEQFAGLGEQYTHLRLNGLRVPVWPEEQGIGRGESPISKSLKVFSPSSVGTSTSTYYAVPWVISNHKALELNTKGYCVFDFRKPDEWSIETWDDTLNLRIQAGKSPADHVIRYTARTGRMDTLPDWAYGVWLGVQGGLGKLQRVTKYAKQMEVPLSAVWIQDWVGRRKTTFGSQLWWRWTVDETSYPNFKRTVDSLGKDGVRVLGYVNPFLALNGSLYEEAARKQYLIRKGETPYTVKTPGFPAAMIDLTNAQAVRWLTEVINKNMVANGLSGWMADYGEWLPLDARLSDSSSAYLHHNQYMVEWAKLNKTAANLDGKGADRIWFHRSGYTGSPKYARLFWAGDQMVTWGQQDGFASAITALVTGGLSGMALNHSDVGGYTGTSLLGAKYYRRSAELYKRWAELGAFSPVFRTHEGLRPDLNYQAYSDDDAMRFTARMGKLRQVLQPYMKHLVMEAHLTGLPVLRPLMLHYPSDDKAWIQTKEMLLGRDVLVLPVTTPGETTVRAYFPEGRWVCLWRKETIIEGPTTQTVEAPLGEPAFYVLENSPWLNGLQDALRKAFPR
jgi:sulfoquinovosidase